MLISSFCLKEYVGAANEDLFVRWGLLQKSDQFHKHSTWACLCKRFLAKFLGSKWGLTIYPLPNEAGKLKGFNRNHQRLGVMASVLRPERPALALPINRREMERGLARRWRRAQGPTPVEKGFNTYGALGASGWRHPLFKPWFN